MLCSHQHAASAYIATFITIAKRLLLPPQLQQVHLHCWPCNRPGAQGGTSSCCRETHHRDGLEVGYRAYAYKKCLIIRLTARLLSLVLQISNLAKWQGFRAGEQQWRTFSAVSRAAHCSEMEERASILTSLFSPPLQNYVKPPTD